MTTDEFGRATLVELMQAAATLDRLLRECTDPDIAARLADIRLESGTVVHALGARYGVPTLPLSQLAYFRRTN